MLKGSSNIYPFPILTVGVGYQYEGCESIFWEMQSATMSGYDITSSEIGRWNLHIHHTYNFQEGQKTFSISRIFSNILLFESLNFIFYIS